MTLQTLYIQGLLLIIGLMTILWIFSVVLRKASIVDPFWGLGFVAAAAFYYLMATEGLVIRKNLVLLLTAIWGLRLFVYLFRRNYGKPEDYRYAQFRKDYGPHRYWWVSFFQVFLLQGILLWLISAPLLTAQYFTTSLNGFDYLAVALWLIGFMFEAGGDYQLARFKRDPGNKGKLLTTGFWRYTRHPNYFGDACIWWSFALFSVAAGSYWPVLSAALMTYLLMKVSGVALLERTMKVSKPGYEDYIRSTPAFFPWFPKKS